MLPMSSGPRSSWVRIMLLAAFLEGAHRVCLFSAALYIGQPVGVSLVAPVIDRYGDADVLHGGNSLWFAGRLAHGKPT
jgi:hypothetical protein